MRDSFIFYRSFYEALRELKPAEQAKVYDAIMQYALDGIEPKLTGACKAVFTLMKPQFDANAKRAENGSNGGRPRKEKNTENVAVEKPEQKQTETEEKPNENQNETEPKPKQNQTETKSEPNVNVNVNDNVNVNEKREGGNRRRFVPPSVSDVNAYCTERHNGIDPQRFVDFYASKGWRVGNQPMKDWKAAVRTWEGRDKKPFMQGNLTHNDLDEIERLSMMSRR